MITGNEVCDDGNNDDGDGCAGDCSAVEEHYSCEDYVELPSQVAIAVTYRDFKADHQPGGHPDFEWEPDPSRRGMPGPVCTTTNTNPCATAPGVACPSGTCARLDAQGKPVHHLTGNASERGRVTNANTYSLWYRNTNPTNIAGHHGAIDMWNRQGSLVLAQVTPGQDSYRFDSGNHFPLDGQGFGNYSNNRNYHFTTELRYFFQYQGGETLSFRGDDDVWVFINGRLAVDIGGVHGPQWGRVILGDDGDGGATDSNCSAHASGSEPAACSLQPGEIAGIADDKRFGLTQGGLYEIVLFHAERHTTGSNFRLTLNGFLAPRSFCTPTCGDGILLPGEVCDDGEDNNTNVDDGDPSTDATGVCNDTCTYRAYCGDGEVNVGEECDNGVNLDLYVLASDPAACAPGCQLPPTCGDGIVQAAFESCDNGAANNDSSYGPSSCTTSCGFGGYCGDGVRQMGEFCDRGAQNGIEYGPSSCGYDCLQGPFCGDGVRNGTEQCDGTPGCDQGCMQGPYCGDGLTNNGEVCDWGAFASNAYGGCTAQCSQGPRCGDGNMDPGFEDCDQGSNNQDGVYDGCTTTCNRGPHCGDAVLQSIEGEFCDNGFNDDTYRFDETSCGPGCVEPPRCGDGMLEPSQEDCDLGQNNSNTTYNGCKLNCRWGPYCGDGIQDPSESCDNGAGNTAYSQAPGGCGYDCEPTPFCGDGIRNGPEQCDEGTASNTGGYGKCKPNCTRDTFCGDGIVQASAGEQCDDGPTGSLNCSVTCRGREIVK